MFGPKNVSIRSCFFKIFVTDLNTKFFHYEPCSNKPLLFIRSKAGHAYKSLATQKVIAFTCYFLPPTSYPLLLTPNLLLAKTKFLLAKTKFLLTFCFYQKRFCFGFAKGQQKLCFCKQKVSSKRYARSQKQKIRLGISKQKGLDLDKKNYQIIRPLLYLSRSNISLICKKLLIPVYPDKSNQCIKYSRNRIRKQLLPSLKLFYNPQIEQALFQFAEFVCKEQDFVTVLLNAIPHNFLKIVKEKNTK